MRRRAPKNLSVVRDLYAGPGGFDDQSATIEAHLSKIERAASIAIRKLADKPADEAHVIAPEIWRFLTWQAARTPGWMSQVEKWIDEMPVDSGSAVEPPPIGFESIRDRDRSLLMVNPSTGERREIAGSKEVGAHKNRGWKIVLRRDDHLEMMHIQAWYFQVRHFPRLAWSLLHAPDADFFVTSDRAVAWLVDGYADAPPAALRDPNAQIVAPLTKKMALVGRHQSSHLNVTPQEVNRFTAFAAGEWIAGPTSDSVERALADVRSARGH